MNKKIFLILGAILLFLIGATANAKVPMYYDNNPNLILMYENPSGTAFYLDKTSLVNEEYDPPYYKLAINVVCVPNASRGATNFYVVTKHFSYHYHYRSMFVLNPDTNLWRPLKLHASNAEGAVDEGIGEAAFYLAYKIKFHDLYDSKFYKQLRK